MKDKREYDAYIQKCKIVSNKNIKTNEFPKHKCSLC